MLKKHPCCKIMTANDGSLAKNNRSFRLTHAVNSAAERQPSQLKHTHLNLVSKMLTNSRRLPEPEVQRHSTPNSHATPPQPTHSTTTQPPRPALGRTFRVGPHAFRVRRRAMQHFVAFQRRFPAAASATVGFTVMGLGDASVQVPWSPWRAGVGLFFPSAKPPSCRSARVVKPG